MSLNMKKSISSSGGHIGSIIIEKSPDFDIKAICNNCGKRFKSMRAITMHLKITGARHTVNFFDHGNYNSDTGMKKIERPALTKDVPMIPQVPSILSGKDDLRVPYDVRGIVRGRAEPN
jgi:hypothetical protein